MRKGGLMASYVTTRMVVDGQMVSQHLCDVSLLAINMVSMMVVWQMNNPGIIPLEVIFIQET